MRNEARAVLERFEVRKTNAQKEAFLAYLCPLLQKNGYEASVVREKGLTKSRNVVVGDLDRAKVVYTAHYDTCAVLPFPNFITPRSPLWYGLYQILIVLLIVTLGILAELLLLLFWPEAPLGLAIGLVYLVMLFCFWWMLCGGANKHSANDNTSGVATLLSLLLELPAELRDDVCVIFFDNEEKGLCGSGALAKRCKNAQKHALVVNFDCVGDGESLHFFPTKALKRERETLALIEDCFTAGGALPCEMAYRSGLYPSDQVRFARGVGVCALRKHKLFGYYLSRIHTARDTVLREQNVDQLAAGAVNLARELHGAEAENG